MNYLRKKRTVIQRRFHVFSLLGLIVILLLLESDNLFPKFITNIDNSSEGVQINQNTDIQDPISPITPLPYEIKPKSSFFSLQAEDVAQFDVQESIRSDTPSTSLAVDTENLTIDLPETWDLTKHQMNLKALYKSWQVVKDPYINIASTTSPWLFYTSQAPAPPKYWGFSGNYLNQRLNINGSGALLSILQEGLHSYWYQSTTKPNNDVEIWETDFLSTGTSRNAFYNFFTTEPSWDNDTAPPEEELGYDWQKLLKNPYGGETESATRTLTYNEVENALAAYIKAGTSSLTLGNPSIGWSANYTEPTTPDFIPKRFELYLSWKIENLNYDAMDNLSVIVRVDGNYVSGLQDLQGNQYSNATEHSIENSWNNSGYLQHDYIVRAFDITDLIDTQKSSHIVDFGIWFENINETSDEVRVSFNGIMIRAVEEDQKKIGDLTFDCGIKISSLITMQNWYLFTIVGNENSSIFLPIGYLTNLFSSLLGYRQIHLNLTSRLKYIFDSSSYFLAIGVIYFGPTRRVESSESVDLKYDNIFLNLQYKVKNFATAGLQRWGGAEWISQTTSFITATTPIINNQLQMVFQTTNTSYLESRLDFSDFTEFQRILNTNASASYSITNINPTSTPILTWSIDFNNSQTFQDYLDWTFQNINPVAYNFTVVDLPAWDNLGSTSEDWKYSKIIDPLEEQNPDYATVQRLNGTNQSGMSQNITIINATALYAGGFVNGTWTLTFESRNYLQNVSILHSDGGGSRFYNGNETQILVNQTGSADYWGHYNLTIKNPLDTVLFGFPQYNSSISGNLNETWTVMDSGAGIYTIYALWNDTTSDPTPQTKRLGIYVRTFQVWRRTHANLLFSHSLLNAGAIGSFYLNYSQGDWSPISGAASTISLYYDDTDHIWGLDWSPYQSLIELVQENATSGAQGNYTLSFKTRNVPIGNYSVYLHVSKPFFDEQLLYAWINLTGYGITLEIIDGATMISAYAAYMDEDNFPRVNMTGNSIIYLSISNTSNLVPLQNGIVTGIFNGTSTVFYGDEIYRFTQKETDLGLYRVIVNGTGLSTTNLENIWNYSLTLTAAIEGYNTVSVGISTEVLPVSATLEGSPLNPVYEDDTFNILVQYKNINIPSMPIPIENAQVVWNLVAENGSILLGGICNAILPGLYSTTINLNEQLPDIEAGIYTIEINASSLNCENSTWSQTNFQITSKVSTEILLSTTSTLQIGTYLQIQARLKYYYNTTIIPNVEVLFVLEFVGSDPLQIIRMTNTFGVASYNHLIAAQYAETSVQISVIYEGTNIIAGTTTSVTKFIYGQNEVNLTLAYSSEIRVGYANNLTGSISIERTTQYSDIFVTLAAWYDGNEQNLVFLQQIYPDLDGSFGYTTPIIEDGHSMITFFVDYAGTAVNEYAQFSILNQLIQPKWECTFSILEIPPILRIGQELQFIAHASFLDPNSTELFAGEKFRVIYDYEGNHLITEYFMSDTNQSIITFIIPQDCTDWLNITLEYAGNLRIAAYTFVYNWNILPKWETNFAIDGIPSEIHLGGEFQFNITAQFLNSSCPETLNGMQPTITLLYAGQVHLLPDTVIIGNLIPIQILIPAASNTDFFNISINFAGTSTIQAFSYLYSFEVLPQISTQIVLLESSTVENFIGRFTFSVKLVDSQSQVGLGSQTIEFLVKERTITLFNVSAITNQEGIATVTLELENVGQYYIEPFYNSIGIYQSASVAASTAEFYSVRVVNVWMIILDNIIPISIGVVGFMLFSFVIYRGVYIPRRNRARAALVEIHNRFADIENMQYMLIIHKTTSVTIFSQAFSEIPIDENLISGFLSAITSFGKQIGEKVTKQEPLPQFGPKDLPSDQTTSILEELVYKQFKIVVIEGEFIRTATLLLKPPSVSLKQKIRNFNSTFERINKQLLMQWTGQIPDPAPIMELIEKAIFIDLLYPHNLITVKADELVKKIPRRSIEALIISQAKRTFNNTFKVRDMINTLVGFGRKDVETFNGINSLRKNGIVYAVNSRTNFLIEKFKPIIQDLSKDQKRVLMEILKGTIDEKTLEHHLGIPIVISVLTALKKKELIRDSNALTELGEVVATLLNMIPD